MTDGDALFRAILTDPDDDLPRLAYADWLEEQGRQPRAQFIRRQCEAARLASSREPADKQRFEEATIEACNLLAAHENEWLAELPCYEGMTWGIGRGSLSALRFRRGFAHSLIARDWPSLSLNGENAMAASAVEWLRIEGLSGGALANWSPLSRITRLDLSGNERFYSTDAEALAHSPHLGRLRWLDMGGCNFGDGGVIALVRSKWFARIERLDYLGSWCGNDLLAELVRRGPCQLRHLDLSGTRIDGGPLRQLFAQPQLRLQRLALEHCQLSYGVRDIVDLPSAAGLRHLNLRGNNIVQSGARHIIESPHLDELQLLDLRNNTFPARICRALRDRFDGTDCRLLLDDGEGTP